VAGLFAIYKLCGQGLVPVGNGQAACGLKEVLAGGTGATAAALFLAGAFFAAAFLAGAFLAGAFFAAAFLAGAFFAAAFLAGAFFAAAFLAGAFLAGAFLAGAFFAAAFLAGALFAAAFLAGAFFATAFLADAFFAVAISFLLDQVAKKPRRSGVPDVSGYSPSEVCPGGAPRYDEFSGDTCVPLLCRYITGRMS
jgi:hypothetical protein